MSNELKPCPFCGKTTKTWDQSPGYVAHETGSNCALSGLVFSIDAWNRRASPWKPIETARPDGNEFVAIKLPSKQDRNGRRPNVYHFLDGAIVDNDDFICEGLTHWMPLPEPPKPA